MGYIVLSKKQVEGSLNVKLCKDKDKADSYRKQLINQYHDVVILSKGDHKLVASKLFKKWVNEGFNEEDKIDPIWNGPSEDLLCNSSDTNSNKHQEDLDKAGAEGSKEFLPQDFAPQCYHEDEDGDEFYMSSNGNRYYLFSKVVTLKGDRQSTIYIFGKKEWSRTNDLTLLRFFNIPYDKCVVENSSGFPLLKTDVHNDHDKHLRDKEKNEII